MIKTIYFGFNCGDTIELFYDKKNKKYILFINGNKKILNNKGKIQK